MKQTAILLFALSFTGLALAQSNSLQEGNNCFAKADYACAIEKYKEAIKSPDERQKKIGGDNLRQAEKCIELRGMGGAAFNNKNFSKAKEYYQSVLDINSKDAFAQSQIITCEKELSPTLRKATTAELTDIWMGKYGNLAIRRQNLMNAGIDPVDAQTRINAGEGKPKEIEKKATHLSVSKSTLYFTSFEEKSEPINVHTDGDSYSIPPGYIPTWCTIKTYSGYFIVIASGNPDEKERTFWFKVTSDDKEVKINVTQAGIMSSIERKPAKPVVAKRIKGTNCFNCPKTKDTWGLTAGYSEPDYSSYFNLEGVHFGLRIEPLFKYGFGLNTGLVFGAYTNDVASLDVGSQFVYYGLSIPLQLEYRLNFSKKFNLFAYGGAGINVLTNSTIDDNYSQALLEYGGGFRVGHVQFNFGKSSYMGDLEEIEEMGKVVLPFQSLVFFVSYMF